jgi:CCR4-NOT transcription complex subunit 6
LQEIEKINFEKYFANSVEVNYEMLFEKRPGLTCDGLAMFYNRKQFKKVEYEAINLNSLNNLSAYLKKIIKYPKQNNIAQLLLLQPTDTSYYNNRFDYLLLVNLHLHWDPQNELLKYAQISEILNRTYLFKEKFKFCEKLKIPIIICGDFNSLPDSNVVNLLHGEINKDKINQNELPGFLEIFSKTKGLNLNDTHLNDFYCTNIKNNFSGKLDYIFHSPDIDNCEISYIDTKHFTSETALPNSFHGSDHIYLISNFYI